MTIKELKEVIKNLPDTMEVVIDERTSDFKFGSLESAYTSEITFSEEPESEPIAKDIVLILSDQF